MDRQKVGIKFYPGVQAKYVVTSHRIRTVSATTGLTARRSKTSSCARATRSISRNRDADRRPRRGEPLHASRVEHPPNPSRARAVLAAAETSAHISFHRTCTSAARGCCSRQFTSTDGAKCCYATPYEQNGRSPTRTRLRTCFRGDNSSHRVVARQHGHNKHNPDPTAWVGWGSRRWMKLTRLTDIAFLPTSSTVKLAAKKRRKKATTTHQQAEQFRSDFDAEFRGEEFRVRFGV